MLKASLIINLLISFLLIHQTLQLEPFITEYIIPFDLPIDDLKNVAANQLSRNQFKTNTFKTDNVTVSKLIFKSIYNGSGKIVDPKQQSSFHTVWNDSIDLVVTYTADIHKLPTTKKTFNGTTQLKIYANYTKRLVVENDTTQITGVDVVVDQKSFKMSYTGNPSDNQKKKLDQINNGVVSGKNNITILSLLKTQQFTKQAILTFFKQNLVNQKISPTYQSTYNYKFANINPVFDMTTSGVKNINHGIAHYLKAKIKNFAFDAQQTQNDALYQEGYHTLISVDFLNYFMRYNTQQNPDWVNFKINQNNFPSRVFKFRLVDLQFLFPNLATKYGEFYLNYIPIVCSPNNFDDWQFDEQKNNLKLSMVWHCQGKLDGPNPSVIALDFQASLSYLIEVRLYSSNMLKIYLSETELQGLEFQPIDGELIQDTQLANTYAFQIVQMLRGWTVGTSFKVKDNSSKIMLKKDIGIYIG